MQQPTCTDAIELLGQVLATPGRLETEDQLRLARLALEIGQTLSTLPVDDPRTALLLAGLAESLHHSSTRLQIQSAHLVETTQAHTLEADELEELRICEQRGTLPELQQPPRRCTGRATCKDPAALLSAWLTIDGFAAQRRIDDAHYVIGQFDMHANPRGPQFTRIAQRFHDKTCPPQQALNVARRLAKLETRSADESELPGATALTSSGKLVEKAADELLDEPDLRTRTSELNKLFKAARTQRLTQDPSVEAGLFRLGEKHGLQRYELLVQASDAEVLESLIVQADNPRTKAGSASRQPVPDGTAAAPSEYPDFLTPAEANLGLWKPMREPSVGQRRLKALLNLLQFDLRKLSTGAARQCAEGEQDLADGTAETPNPDDVPTQSPATSPVESPDPSALVRPTVIVHLKLDELLGLADSAGVTEHGLNLRAAELRQVLAKAQIIPMVLGSRGEVLDIGRAGRQFPRAMRRAIKARDRGCVVPGCTVPVELCEIHHIQWWSRGGPTSVANGMCVCKTHHMDIHAGLITALPNHGLPMVILPRYQDPEQKPRRNRINQRAFELSATEPRAPEAPPIVTVDPGATADGTGRSPSTE